MMRRQRLQSYVPPELQRRFRAYCRVRGISESAVIQTLIEELLDGEVNDSAAITTQLDRSAVAMGRLQRDVQVLSEVFAAFAHSVAPSRYTQVTEAAESRLRSGTRLVFDVLKEDPFAQVDDPPGEDG